ncbi:MAG: hypothetical protein FWG93_01855 [Oscillospiraceae bacterium]|nr:hypothetical protein [Oscillospiraceae bacterium]
MRLFYSVTRAPGLLIANRFQAVILTVCFSVCFLLPSVMHLYYEGSVKIMESPLTSDYTIYMTALETDGLFILKDYDKLRELLPEGTSVFVRAGRGINSLVYGTISRLATVYWILPPDGTGLVYYPFQEGQISGSLPVSPDELLVGDSVLRGVSAKRLIGSTVNINGREYTICGILRDSEVIYGNIHSLENADRVFLSFMTGDDLSRHYREVEAAFRGYYNAGPPMLAQTIHDIRVEYLVADTRRLLLITVFSLILCLLGCIGIANSVLYDSRAAIAVKLSVGARYGDIFLELFMYLSLISLSAALITALLCLPAQWYLRVSLEISASFSAGTALALGLVSLAVSAVMSIISIFQIARKMA